MKPGMGCLGLFRRDDPGFRISGRLAMIGLPGIEGNIGYRLKYGAEPSESRKNIQGKELRRISEMRRNDRMLKMP